MKTYYKPGRAIITLLSCLLISACSPPPKTPLRVGTNTWLGYESLYVARQLNYFDADSIHLVELPSATNVSHAFQTGNLEAAALTLDEVLGLLQSNVKLKIVLIMDTSNGADALLGQSDMGSLAELKGRHIGYENTAVGALLLNAALVKAGLEPNEVTLEPIPYSQHRERFVTRAVDAVVTFEPIRTQLLSEGAVSLFDSSQIPGRIVDVLVVSEAAAKKYAPEIKHLIEAHFKALSFFNQNPEEGARLMAPRLDINTDEILNSFKGLQLTNLSQNKEQLLSSPPPLQTTASDLAQLMLDNQLLQRRPILDNAFTGEFLPEK